MTADKTQGKKKSLMRVKLDIAIDLLQEHGVFDTGNKYIEKFLAKKAKKRINNTNSK